MKTTVYLDDDAYRRLKTLAEDQGRPTAELIRIAVTEYAARNAERPWPRSIGSVRSGDGTLSERFEELLDGFGES